MKLLVMNTFK